MLSGPKTIPGVVRWLKAHDAKAVKDGNQSEMRYKERFQNLAGLPTRAADHGAHFKKSIVPFMRAGLRANGFNGATHIERE